MRTCEHVTCDGFRPYDTVGKTSLFQRYMYSAPAKVSLMLIALNSFTILFPRPIKCQHLMPSR